ncbi:14551_t:CDS:2 [Funneliformis geosporum]|uniref:8511_t:CDS:1 n=1 Tax=Funneliformis geosporum TaxID=1117311 RepID=A0A9W4SXF0_9GLOM|nr:8511_t:CDS:2 [Funneliformis geosporum]CAI2185325.1 14551_t:CDS:2 [Funneliformis geosporum]
MNSKEGNYFHPTRMSEHSRVQRLKLTPNYRLNNNYPLPANMLRYSSQEILPPIQTGLESDTEFEIKPTIKRTCARCKESNKCVKLIRSKINRLEELVKNIEKTTENTAFNYTGIKYQESQPQPLTPLPQIMVTQPSSYDFSNCSMEDLQLVISAITNTMMFNRNSYVK